MMLPGTGRGRDGHGVDNQVDKDARGRIPLCRGILLSLSRALFWGSFPLFRCGRLDSRARSPFSVHESNRLLWIMAFSQIARSHCRLQSDMLRLSRGHQNATAEPLEAV